jgi:hypothetical protein
MDEEENFDYLDDLLFGDGCTGDHFPVGNELQWDDHFLDGRESGAGPDIENNSFHELIQEGWTRDEVLAAMAKFAAQKSKK